ncbi:WDR44 family WD repeat protein [Schizosaccharomyces japonicus yFS275]|uniref:WDR44 family WD repeat protein n=1 Tax=Schizosaccharomyces japonicus (strain yFS275 / FY16936) TaxID=402676 RepID=B6K479_SCHJY|nr:WDR44 family WD repeat protein [Schizosaccharomyces japonicus yFS275]EEB08286.1 WDR44 family WD repeat protein [Schizosaccharomyces japonicus yFS275]
MSTHHRLSLSKFHNSTPDEGANTDYMVTKQECNHIALSGPGNDCFAEGKEAEKLLPIRYIPTVTGHMGKKCEPQLSRLYVAQILSPTDICDKTVCSRRRADGVEDVHPVWASEISHTGKYLATAGKKSVVQIWRVVDFKSLANLNVTSTEYADASVFTPKPILECKGHTADILCISWSKNDFLLTSSNDATVRLWHPKVQNCLAVFKHTEIVMSVAFHPIDDRYFISGTLDSRLLLWSILDRKPIWQRACTDLISTVAFFPDGRTIALGFFNGKCTLYTTDKLKPLRTFSMHKSASKNAKCRVTGLQCVNCVPQNTQSNVLILISTTDSRIRVYSLLTSDYIMNVKNVSNPRGQILARFNDNNRFIITGGMHNVVVVYHIPQSFLVMASTKGAHAFIRKLPYEMFQLGERHITSCLIAPQNTSLLLAQSGDIMYRLSGLIKSSATSDESWHLPVGTDFDIIICTDELGRILICRQDINDLHRKQSLHTSENLKLVIPFYNFCAKRTANTFEFRLRNFLSTIGE